MSQIKDNLIQGEAILYETRQHWAMLLFPAIASLFIIGIPWFLLRLLSKLSSEFAVTNRRVIIHISAISSRAVELQLSKIESVGVEQGLLGKLFGYGSVVIGGTGGSKEYFPFIEQPFAFRQKVQEQLSPA